MSQKMKDALEMIDQLVVEMNNFHFLQQEEAPHIDYMQTHSCVDELEIIGREDEQEKVVMILLDHSHNNRVINNNNNVMVLPIVGMGGIGKTTLAQLVHNDQRVRHRFELVLWACVSDKFIIEEIIRSIIEVATKRKCDLTQMEALQEELCGVLGNKRYLLVMDDVWNEDRRKWDYMRSFLCSHPGKGSAIIVTSRSDQVASIMGTVPPHRISVLNEDQSWELFRRNAFGREVENQYKLISMAKNIVQKCKGLPLAIMTMSTLLHSKHHNQWLSILESDVWKNDILENEIVPALQLNYDHLSPEQKICFSLCAIFPKDSLIDKDMLIHLWMANDFIASEIRGQEIFDVLVSRCFLQDVKIHQGVMIQMHLVSRFDIRSVDEFMHNDDLIHRTTTCEMHDLIHDLAYYISGNDCSILQETSLSQENFQGSIDASSLPHEVRHLSLDNVGNNTIAAMKEILAPRPRTILVWQNTKWIETHLSMVESKFASLRALKTFSVYTMMANLKHIRYLDCSYSTILELPEATAMLYSLQTLKLICCQFLTKLPEGMRYMRSLRHIFLIGCDSLERMPQGIGQLNSLQTLTKYVVDSGAGHGIDQLKDLNLGGALCLIGLRKVRGAETAIQGNMSGKHNLKRLSLDWANEPYSTHVGYAIDTNAEGILEALRPHKGLEVLLISHYTGAKFSSWMHNSTLLEHLSELRVSACNCKDLPPLWQLPSLRYLGLDSMDNLISLFHGTDYINKVESSISPPAIFRKLETMIVSKMPNLERWHLEVIGQVINLSFPRLKKLHISECPMLGSMPKMLPLLDDLLVRARYIRSLYLMNLPLQYNLECKGSISVRPIDGWVSASDLRFSLLGDSDLSLKLEDFTGNIENFEEELNGIPCRFIKKLDIIVSNCLFSFEPSQIQQNIWNHFRFIERLFISRNDSIVHWPVVEFRNLNCLRHLELLACSNLVGSLPATSYDLLPRLENLVIGRCENLVEIPKLPASLKKLLIGRCPKLVSMPKILGNIKKLKELDVHGCDALITFSDGMHGVTMLKKLEIERCPRLDTLPEGLLQQLPALEELCITDCPNLEKAFSRGGAYWGLVKFIPKRSIG